MRLRQRDSSSASKQLLTTAAAVTLFVIPVLAETSRAAKAAGTFDHQEAEGAAYASRILPRHAGHDTTPPDPSVPLDSLIWAHMDIQMLCWGILYPVGMVLGLTRSRWHVPWQSATTLITLAGFQLGHHHGGRRFYHTVHGTFATFCFWFMLSQIALGIFCKLHIYEDTIRPPVAKVHSIFGKLFPLVSWSQIVFGIITVSGFCFDHPGDHLGQCLAHHIMGSSFQLYGIVLLLMARYGADWLKRHQFSQEFLDSTMIMCWGVVNTFTEHDLLHQRGVWSHKDMQHTSLGVMWWAGGALGMWLGRHRQRTIIPSLVFALTGFAMSSHEQSTMFSTKIHQIFGGTLIGAGFCRIIEICFVLREEHAPQDGHIGAFQHLSPLLFVVAGMTFQSSNEEQLALVAGLQMDHVTYALIIFSGASLLYLYVNLLMSLWERSGQNAPPQGHTLLPTTFPRMSTFRESLGQAIRRSEEYMAVPRSAPAGQHIRLQTPTTANSGDRPRRISDEVSVEDDVELTDAYWDEQDGTKVARS